MRGCNCWQYTPYIPLDEAERLAAPYICRLAPRQSGVELECADPYGPAEEILLFWSERGAGRWESRPVRCGTVVLDGLRNETEYELYVQAGERRSAVRLVKTGTVPGVAVNYLHPQDPAYAFSGRYLCSPSLARLPTGVLLASMDLHAGNRPQNLTLLCRSDDGGWSWRYVAELFPCFWGTLFWHRDALYMLGVSNEYGDLLIGRSDDEGTTWSAPTVLFRGSCCTHEKGLHRAPMPVIPVAGRLWTEVDYGAWESGCFANGLISIDEEDDLLCAENWRCTGFLRHDPAWRGARPVAGAIEGNAVEAPDGSLAVLLRYSDNQALLLRGDPDKPEAALRFDRFVEFPMAHSKFEVRRHPNGSYYAVGNRLPMRNVLALYASEDLLHWEKRADLLDYAHLPAEEVAFQYPSFCFDGGDLLVLSRTAFGGADSYHNNNYQTFHRVRL